MELSIVIVNYNVRYFLEQCLKSVIEACRGIEAEVWVVDNHSADGSVEMVRNDFPWVNLIANDQNVGFSKANNQAIRQSTGTYVLLLNPDTVVEKDCFIKCISFMNAHSDAGALGVRMIDGSGRFLPESKRGLPDPETAFYKMFGLSSLFPKSKRFGKYHLGYLDEFETHEVDVLAGAFMFMRRSALDQTGLLDETFFMYGEDIDLSYRIQQVGFKNYYFPETTIIHYKGESTKKFSVNYVKVFYQAMIIFAQKHYGKGKAQAFSTLIRIAVVFRAALSLTRRWALQSWQIMLDALIIFGGLLYIKSYWEEHIKYITSYPPELIRLHFPYYTLFWIGSIFISGGYTNPVSVRRIALGVFTGTILILAVYSLFPENLRFSRGIILTGAIWTLLSMTGLRLMFHFMKYRNFNLGMPPELQTVIVGNQDERERVLDLLNKIKAPNRFMGFVSPEPANKCSQLIGELSQLREIIDMYQIGEVIFCGKDVPAADIILWMNRTADLDVQFKIVPESSRFIIGSHSKNESGELYTDQLQLRLLNPDNLRKKRLSDRLLSLLLLLLSPFIILFQHDKKGYFLNILNALFGRKTWVGFRGPTSEIPLNIIGIFEPWERFKNEEMNEELKTHFNFLYARDYQPAMDFDVLIKNFRALGKRS